MTIITEYRLRRLFANEGFRVLEIRCKKHWVARVVRDDGNAFNVTVSRTPSDNRFGHQFVKSLRRAEREATNSKNRRTSLCL
jgi:hypothetical protein